MDSMSEELVLANTDVAVLRATCSSTTVLSLDYDEPPPAELRWRYEREESVVRAMAMLCELTDIPWLDFLSQSAPPTQVDEFDSGRSMRIEPLEPSLAPPSGPPPPSCPPSPAHSEPDAGAGFGFDLASEAAAAANAANAANAAITAAGLDMVAATAAHALDAQAVLPRVSTGAVPVRAKLAARALEGERGSQPGVEAPGGAARKARSRAARSHPHARRASGVGSQWRTSGDASAASPRTSLAPMPHIAPTPRSSEALREEPAAAVVAAAPPKVLALPPQLPTRMPGGWHPGILAAIHPGYEDGRR